MRRDLSIILQMGLAFAFIFSAFNSQGLIEISVLRKLAEISPETGITEASGYYSLSIVYFVFTMSNLIVPTLVKKLGTKWSQVCGAFCYLIFMLTFLRLSVSLLYFGSGVLGFGAALLWTGNGGYLVEFSRNGKLPRNSGILWAMLQSSLITGAFFLIYVLRNGDLTSNYKMVYTVFAGVSCLGIICLALLPSYPPQFEQQFEEIVRSESQENLIDEARISEEDDGTIVESVRAERPSVFALLATQDMLCLSVTFLYTGFEMTFYTGVYTACLSATLALKSYSDLVIPYNALALGVGQIIGGVLTGPVLKRFNYTRSQIILMGMIGHVLAFFLCFLMLPFDSTIHPSDMITYASPTLCLTLLIAFLLGYSDACWQTQIYVVIGEMYKKDSVNAFAIYKFFQSMAACISFYYSATLLLHWQLLILTVGCFLSAIFFLRIEFKNEIRNNPPVVVDNENAEQQ
ncbi:unnamed protein product [Caenorhabditis angaria]|uniref:Uncharacterized protein n=1 Tax=Caenorhabditis angaria TaxID=860376 RepID=A0A9P1J334_9PELO|nr:unnamed protein product [Caenorhabditis angaria]